MAISYPLSPPSSPPYEEARFRIAATSGVNSSAFTFKQQGVAFMGQRWEGELTLPRLTSDEARDWSGWLTALRGQHGTFNVGDPTADTPNGNIPSSDTLEVKRATRRTLRLSGASTNTTDYFLQGDMLEINNEYVMVMNDSDSDGNGIVEFPIEPAFTTVPQPGDSVTHQSPKGLFRLATNRTSWTQSDFKHQVTFPIVEAVNS